MCVCVCVYIYQAWTTEKACITTCYFCPDWCSCMYHMNALLRPVIIYRQNVASMRWPQYRRCTLQYMCVCVCVCVCEFRTKQSRINLNHILTPFSRGEGLVGLTRPAFVPFVFELSTSTYIRTLKTSLAIRLFNYTFFLANGSSRILTLVRLLV